MIQKIDNLVKEIEGLVANSAEELEALRLKYLSKKGIINDLMAEAFQQLDKFAFGGKSGVIGTDTDGQFLSGCLCRLVHSSCIGSRHDR